MLLTGHDTSSALNHGRLILLKGHDTSTALNHGHLLMLTGHDKRSVLNHGHLILLKGHDTSTALNHGHLLSLTRNCVVCLMFRPPPPSPPQGKWIAFICETDDKLIPELISCSVPEVFKSVPFKNVFKLCNFSSWSNTREKCVSRATGFQN